jgi:hypothetical protein
LYLAYERYIEVQGERTRAQRLWVPGLDPTYRAYTDGYESISELLRNTEYKKWRASDMDYKNGIEVKRKGKLEGAWTDETKWDREIWSAPDVKNAIKKEESIQKPWEELPHRDVGTNNVSFLRSNDNTSKINFPALTSRIIPASPAPTKLSQSQTPDEASSPLPSNSAPKSEP